MAKDEEVDVAALGAAFDQIPPGPFLVIKNAGGFEIRQHDTDPSNKHHWPFRLLASIPGQSARCGEAVFDFVCGVINTWPQIRDRLA